MQNISQRFVDVTWHSKYMPAAGFLFALTFQKYLKRDPLSQTIGLQGVIETTLTLLTCLIVVFLSRRWPRLSSMPISLRFFGIYGAFALVSSIDSFSVTMSIAKGILYFAVLMTAYLVSECHTSVVFLKGIYRGYIATLLGALTLGVIVPGRYPLFSVDSYTGRTRLNLLATPPNSIGEISGLLFLVAQVLPIRPRWYWQAFLLCVNIYAGEKTATAAVLLCAGLIFVFGHRRIARRLAVTTAVVALGFAGLVGVEAGVISGAPGAYVAHAAEAIYGRQVSAELDSLDGRMQVWKDGAKLAQGRIVFGFGFSGVRELLINDVAWSGHAHNGILQATLTAGIFGMLALLAGWLSALRGALCWDRAWNVRVLSLNLYVAFLAIIGPVFDWPSYFVILLFVVVLYFSFERKRAQYSRLEFGMSRLSAVGRMPTMDRLDEIPTSLR